VSEHCPGWSRPAEKSPGNCQESLKISKNFQNHPKVVRTLHRHFGTKTNILVRTVSGLTAGFQRLLSVFVSGLWAKFQGSCCSVSLPNSFSAFLEILETDG
jgi:hypothetical protein